MNELLEELAWQATEYANEQNELHGVGYVITFKEKFAELIVQECIEINKQELAFNAFERLMNKYQEHFGVEE